MSEFIKGQIMLFAETKCPHCRGTPRNGAIAYTVERIWDGSQWLLLDSWAGKTLALEVGAEKSPAQP